MIVDLVIPARNEAENLAALAEALRPLLDGGTIRRVVLCDNGSTDGTGELAVEAGFTSIVHEPRPGYGNACLAGLRDIASTPEPHPAAPAVLTRTVPAGTPDAVAFLDADLADDPAQLPRLLDPLERGEADLALGRRCPEERGALDPHQRFGNRLACLLLRLTTGRRYRDLGPMRTITWDALQRLDMADRTWGWTVEMQYKAATRGLRVVELDVPYRRRRAGKSKISGSVVGSVRAGTKIIAMIAQLVWQERRTNSEP